MQVLDHTKSLTTEPLPYCPGCGHGIVHRLIAEVIDNMGIRDSVVGITSIGCSVRAWRNFNFDICQGAHGRALAVATGLKRSLPGRVIFTYQGDGDLAAIGLAETLHAVARGEPVTVIFVNNAVFGATGGQAAPTTIPGQHTPTTPTGRDPAVSGNPIRMAELVAGMLQRGYVARVACNNPRNVVRAKRAIANAFKAQVNHHCMGFVEVLAMCPSGWHMSPLDAVEWMERHMMSHYPLAELKVLQNES